MTPVIEKTVTFTFFYILFPKFCLTKERSFKNCDSEKYSSCHLESMVHWKNESENQLYNQRVVEINKAGERELWRSHRAGFTQSRTNLKTDQDVQDLVHWIWVSLTQTWQIFELPLPGPNHSHCEIFSLFTINIVSIVSWTFTVQKCTAPKPCTLNFLKSIKRIFWNTSHHLFCSYPF